MQFESKENLGFPPSREVLQRCMDDVAGAWEFNEKFLALLLKEMQRWPERVLLDGTDLVIRTEEYPPRIATFVNAFQAVWPRRTYAH